MPEEPVQFGGATVIAAGVELILMDCFETLVAMDGGVYRPRLGVTEFLAHFASARRIPVAVVSDGDEQAVRGALQQAGLLAKLGRVFHAGNALERLPGGRARKRLDAVLRELGVPKEKAVFIGDSPFDAEAAQHHGVAFIRVPRSEDRAFSFVRLIGGPSSYRSGEFSLAMLESYRKRPVK